MKRGFFGDRGAALVEMALTTPLLVLIMMGAVELGRLAYFAIEVQNTARAGASYGAVNLSNAFQYPGTVQQAAKDDAPDISNLVVVTPVTACVCETLNTSTNTPSYNPSSGTVNCTDSRVTTGACNTNTSTSSQKVISYVVVSTHATIDPLVHLPGLPSTYTLYGNAKMRVLPN
ncbi:MAG TPA: TadE/TadG family type IV pilus assembly protein [Terracidiphilus sp.]